MDEVTKTITRCCTALAGRHWVLRSEQAHLWLEQEDAAVACCGEQPPAAWQELQVPDILSCRCQGAAASCGSQALPAAPNHLSFNADAHNTLACLCFPSGSEHAFRDGAGSAVLEPLPLLFHWRPLQLSDRPCASVIHHDPLLAKAYRRPRQ